MPEEYKNKIKSEQPSPANDADAKNTKDNFNEEQQPAFSVHASSTSDGIFGPITSRKGAEIEAKEKEHGVKKEYSILKR